MNGARFAPGGRLIATAADGGEIALWAREEDPPNLQSKLAPPPVAAVPLALPNSQALLSAISVEAPMQSAGHAYEHYEGMYMTYWICLGLCAGACLRLRSSIIL